MNSYLGQIPLFQCVPTTEREDLGVLCELRRFRRADVIFEEGHPAESVWIVIRGWVYLVKRTPQGSPVTIFTVTPEEAICGLSAFEHGRYSAGAIAATDTRLLRIPAGKFSELLERNSTFAKQVLLTCCVRIRHMAESLSLAQAPVEQRLAYALLRLQATFGRTIPVTHQELARMAGTRWETSIRTLGSMKRRGWVASARGQVTILAPEQLRATLQGPKGRGRFSFPYGTSLFSPSLLAERNERK